LDEDQTMRLKPSPILIKHVVRGLTRTLHFHLFGTDHLRAAARMSPTGTFVICHWHQSLLSVLGPHHHMPVATLASRSRDGEITARYLETIGLRVVRGSSSRGGADAARELMRALTEGYHVVLNLDGPRGPFKRVKSGALEIARRFGVPLVPIAARASCEFSFKRSWDRFRLPLPGSSVAICYGAPIMFPPESPDGTTLRARQRAIACTMHDLEAEASRRVGRRDGYPLPKQLTWLHNDNNTPSSDQPR
jgi:lysophospholipid acyltransferase (LPLAT)-like uncharacterized protein